MTTHARTADLEIRGVTRDDADAAARLCGELGYPVDAATMRQRIEALAASPDHAVFLAVIAGRPVGWVHVAVVQHLQADVRAEIGGLVVASDCRSSGIGARLVARAEAWARDRGIGGMVVRSQIKREDAHRFYLREGYERTKTSAVFFKELP